MSMNASPKQEKPGAPGFSTLEVLAPTSTRTFIKPAKKINDGQDLHDFTTTLACRDIVLFVLQLNRAMCPRKVKDDEGRDLIQTFLIGSKSETQPAESVRKLQQMLIKIASFIEEAPPDTGPRRFGNISFRKWYQLLEDRLHDLFREYISDSVLNFGAAKDQDTTTAQDELVAYFLGAFGSAQRLDYGTGHELSFLAFLGCLWKLGAFGDGEPGGEIERNIVLGIFEPYLRVVRRLILTYTLEPAGSHGVWGLDDHSFLPYVFGSAQLTRAISEDELMPVEGSLRWRRAKRGQVTNPELLTALTPEEEEDARLVCTLKPDEIGNAQTVTREREKNMYFSAVGFINDVKKGPFWEHSSVLWSITSVPAGWGKINLGMIRMFKAEVLNKFPVVQHFPFGSLFSWEQDPDAPAPFRSVHAANQPTGSATVIPVSANTVPGTAAPWASNRAMPPPTASTRAPWLAGQSTMRPPVTTQANTRHAQIPVAGAPWTKKPKPGI
ncbi:rotamase PTPA-1 [Xylariales sp. PMI_506]|nr:rotamase PTPA-1 [Xylariales sp. PMI_506]